MLLLLRVDGSKLKWSGADKAASLGRVASVTVLGHLTTSERAEVVEGGMDLAPVSLQQLIVRLTQKAAATNGAIKEEVRCSDAHSMSSDSS